MVRQLLCQTPPCGHVTRVQRTCDLRSPAPQLVWRFPSTLMAKLLVVEDDRMFATLIVRALREEGHVLDLAREYAEGRMLAFVHDYDGILLDVQLPDGSGLNIAQELRKDGRTTPILVLTSQDTTADVVRGLD